MTHLIAVGGINHEYYVNLCHDVVHVLRLYSSSFEVLCVSFTASVASLTACLRAVRLRAAIGAYAAMNPTLLLLSPDHAESLNDVVSLNKVARVW